MKENYKMSNKQEEGICPVCNSDNLEYFGFENEGTQIVYKWECNDCHSQGNEWYSMNFVEHEVTYNGKH